jgi:hypothetical protein
MLRVFLEVQIVEAQLTDWDSSGGNSIEKSLLHDRKSNIFYSK